MRLRPFALLLLPLLLITGAKAQEFNCQASVIAPQIATSQSPGRSSDSQGIRPGRRHAATTRGGVPVPAPGR